MRDVAMSCSVLKLLPRDTAGFDPIVFWEHSLGCALVCRQFARKIGFSEPGKAYLAGLLHDIGIIAHLWVAPAEFRATMERASAEHIPLHEAEQAVLGITHAESGRIVAERWHFTPDLVQVVASHHDAAKATSERPLVALVSLSDLLCRMGGLGYGYTEDRQVNFLEEPGFAILEKECAKLDSFDWARFTFELEAYLDEVHQLVNLPYRGPK
jgi:HD-like signal output (HDOD) protein